MKSKIVKCVDCGKEYPRKELNRHFRCRDCAMKAMRDAPHQMQVKQGKYFDQWKEGIRKHVAFFTTPD